MKESLIGNIGTTTVNLLAKAMDSETHSNEEILDIRPREVLTPKQQRRADRKAVRLRKKG